MDTSSPIFTVIIPTFKRDADLNKCLLKLLPENQTPFVSSLKHCSSKYEVIVSDDASSPLTKKLVSEHFSWVKYTQGPGLGPAANRNNGAKHARGEWLVFTDDDCLVCDNWLHSFNAAIQANPSVKAFEGSIHPIGNLDHDLWECPVNYEGGHFWSANIAITRSLFKKIGGFDEAYPYAAHEDQDLKIKIEKFDYIHFVQEAIVLHPVRVISFWQSVLKIAPISYSWGYHLAKNGNYLGILNGLDVYLQSFSFNLFSAISNLKKCHVKQAFVKSIYLLVGSHLTFFSYFFWRKKMCA